MRWPPLAPLLLQHTACFKAVAGLIGLSFAGHYGRVLAKCTVMSERRTTTRPPSSSVHRRAPRPFPVPVGSGRGWEQGSGRVFCARTRTKLTSSRIVLCLCILIVIPPVALRGLQ